ncbi:unnamed protein product [Thelazia callipaeda]|uniref:Uncharacterized protein n=1 Tax=Thelazia callipaeda TaxID=103827 RepID=A0A0N5DC56_THECL|nr:unnamed protein product [Thelazia callipaeda]
MMQLAISSCIISWLHVLYPLRKSFQRTLKKYDEWCDACLCKLLSEAMESRDDLILSVCQNSLCEVKRYATMQNACASCKLMIFLLRCSMQKDQRERFKYWYNRSAVLETFISRKINRKFALAALLNSWQILLEPHIKISNLSAARKYSRDFLQENKSEREPLNISENVVTSEKKKKSFSSAIPLSSGMTTTDDPTPKQLDIILPVFFWPLFKVIAVLLKVNQLLLN